MDRYDDIVMAGTGGGAAGGGGGGAAGGGGGGAAGVAALPNLSSVYGAYERAGSIGYTGRADPSNPEFVKALDMAVGQILLEKMFTDMNSLVTRGGAYGKTQRGGDSAFIAACKQVYNNVTGYGGTIAARADAAGADAVIAMLGDRDRAMRTAGLAAAAGTVAFGVPEFPFLTTALWNAAVASPGFIYSWAVNIVGAAISAAELAVLGAAGVAMLVLFTIATLTVYYINQGPGLAVRAAIAKGKSLVRDFYSWGASVVGGAPAAAAAAAEAAQVAPAAAAAAAPAVEKYRVGIMVISGPNAAEMARRFANRAAGANISNLRVGGYRKTRRGRKSHRKSHSKVHRKSHRKVHRKSHRKSRRQH